MVSIQDQVVSTRNYQKYIIKENIPTDKCRRCNSGSETVEHVLSGCQSLAATEVLERHNKVVTIIYLELLKKWKIDPPTNEPYYKFKPLPVMENDTVKIY